MTIFDSIKYPLNDTNHKEMWDLLPGDIRTYWIAVHHSEPEDMSKRITLLNQIIFEYNTEVCRVRRRYDNI